MEPTFEPLGIRGKLALASEVLAAYLPSYRLLRSKDVEEMVRLARNVLNPATRTGGPVERLETLRLGRAVGRTLRLLPTDSRCLIQSLVVTRMLARRSIPSTLVIGVRMEPKFEAHAWVEYEGRPILPAGEFRRLVEL